MAPYDAPRPRRHRPREAARRDGDRGGRGRALDSRFRVAQTLVRHGRRTAGSAGRDGSRSDPAAAAKTRVLYASFPNAVDAKGVGRFTADVWMTNTDAAKSADVTMLMSPLPHRTTGPAPADGSQQALALRPDARGRRDAPLPKPPRGRSSDYEGACFRSRSVRSRPRSARPPRRNRRSPRAGFARRAGGETPLLAGSASRSFGSEMRPVAPGEGAKRNADPAHVVSGLENDANRRTNLLLAETSGYDTTIRDQRFQAKARPSRRDGQLVDFKQTGAGGPDRPGQRRRLSSRTGPPTRARTSGARSWSTRAAPTPSASRRGRSFGLATVIDNRTQDTSLRVGVSTTALNPTFVPASSLAAARTALASLPYGGDAAPLAFPTVHSAGATLATGGRPCWRTRLTMTNTSTTEDRNFRLKYVDAAAT